MEDFAFNLRYGSYSKTSKEEDEGPLRFSAYRARSFESLL